MKILLCGAGGFIGRHLRTELELLGHTVVGAGSARGAHQQLVVDYARDVRLADWLPRLEGVDAVINAVGVLRDSVRRPIQAVHTDTPQALFDACCEAGRLRGKLLRVIHISALGVGDDAQDNPTRYASTKRAADAHLLQLHAAGQLNATVLRPSIVFGSGGASSQMFVALSKLPLVVLPKPVLTARVQPIAVGDLARGVALLVQRTQADALYECVGATALPLVDFIASLRTQQGYGRAHIAALPDWLSRISARIGDYIPVAPWCSETLALLAHDNVSNSPAFAQVLGGKLLPTDQFWSRAWSR